MNAIDKPAPAQRLLHIAEWIAHEARNHPPNVMANYVRAYDNLRQIAAELQRPDPGPTFGDMFLAIRSATTATELGTAWAGLAPHQPDLPDNDRIRLMEHALGRLLAIEARHEGDGR